MHSDDGQRITTSDQNSVVGIIRANGEAMGSFVALRAKRGAGNFLDGCQFVYSSWWTAISRIFFPVFKLGVGYGLVSLALFSLVPGLYRHVVALSVRAVAALTIPCAYFRLNWTFLFSLVLLPFSKIFKTIGWQNVAVGIHPISKFALTAIYVAPILEEIMFRFGCDMFCDLKKYRNERSRTRGVTPELCFSILFGLTHFSNHIKPAALFVPDLAVAATHLALPLYFALMQGLLTYKCSRLIFFPVYRKHGLMGSIGAHMTWNAVMLAVSRA